MAEVTNILDTLQVIITRISLNLPKSLRLSMIISRQVLNNHLRRAEATHKKLTAAKCKLEHNISVKITSVNIDANILMNREVNTALHTQRKPLLCCSWLKVSTLCVNKMSPPGVGMLLQKSSLLYSKVQVYPMRMPGSWQKVLDECLKQKEATRRPSCETARSNESGSTLN